MVTVFLLASPFLTLILIQVLLFLSGNIMKGKNKEIHSICKIYVNKFRKHNRFVQVGIYERVNKTGYRKL